MASPEWPAAGSGVGAGCFVRLKAAGSHPVAVRKADLAFVLVLMDLFD